MRKLIVALAALAAAAPAQAEPPKVPALKDIYAAGFRDCAEAMANAVKFIHGDDEEYAYLGLWSQRRPNTEMATAMTSQAFSDGHAIGTISAAKTTSGACNVTLTHVFSVPDQTCPRLRDTSFKDWKFYSDFGGASLYEDPTTPNSNLSMSAIGNSGCLVVKNILFLGD